jgi:hypothetical protein
MVGDTMEATLIAPVAEFRWWVDIWWTTGEGVFSQLAVGFERLESTDSLVSEHLMFGSRRERCGKHLRLELFCDAYAESALLTSLTTVGSFNIEEMAVGGFGCWCNC